MPNIKTMFAMMNGNGDANGSADANGNADAGAAPEPAIPPKASKAKGPATIEKIYQKKTQLEHILLRPDTYIGSVEQVEEQMWVFDKEKGYMVQKKIKYVPGLYKIFDEILVNAADNKQRDPSMDCIKIDLNQDANTISVWNNGKGIPVTMHKEENIYVPTMIFGYLLTSSNYDDNEEKVVGGRNGYGAKLCNIFSTKFIVETANSEYKKHFKQTWGSNMTKTSDPKIKPLADQDYTKIQFCPDLTKFGMDRLDDDIVLLMSRRAYDVAASTRGVKVILNGERIKVKGFKDYIDLYLKSRENDPLGIPKVLYEAVNPRWEVAVTLTTDNVFQQVSFVNSIATTKGGRHVDYVTDMIVKQLIEILKKKNKGGMKLTAAHVKQHMWIFINCLIVNPTFDSQTKENMTTQLKKFGSKCDLSDKFVTTFAKSGIIESVLSWVKFKEQDKLAKTSGSKKTKLKGIPKLEDANEAGRKNAHKCTLILTEGDSAKSLVVSGLSVVGRDYYGVFPLRGKLLNVREATHKQVMENAEISMLIKILGINYKKKYTTMEDLKTLRYGKIMIMTDQDQDGSHIKGLIINFIHHFWPDLLRLNFLEVFITPIVKVTKKKIKLAFYSLPELEEWRQQTPDHEKYSVKYYKGLGTSKSEEIKEYFQDMDRHRIALRYSGQDDDRNILLAFSKKEVDNRKEWLLRHNDDLKRRKELGLSEVYLYTKNIRTVTFSEYVNKELVYYSNSDNVRSIPSLIDGLKPGQRKVLYTCIKRNDKSEVKVAQLSGSVSEMTAYHHGEVSLQMTIVNLAQNFVGSNNINLLEPRGQFGTRLNGGKDSASARYIFTKMSPLTRLIFHPHDDPLLRHERDDNQKVEPVWYIPIIPMVLVNGADGIGTGWRTKLPNFNPREIVENIRLMLDGKEPNPMKPWYKNFVGTIEACGEQKYITSGEISITDNDEIDITELPIGTWTQTYKENVLEVLLHGTEKIKTTYISDYKEYSTDTSVRFLVTPLPGKLADMEKDGLHNIFKLHSALTLSSMVLFDEFGGIKKYEDVDSILQEYYIVRLRMYVKRKEFLENDLNAEVQRLTYQAKFIMDKCSGKISIENKQRKTMISDLVKLGYPPDPVKEWKQRYAQEMNDDAKEDKSQDEEENEEEGEEVEEETVKGSKVKKEPVDSEKAFKNLSDVKKYDYLLGMSLWMLTLEKKNQLLKQRDDKMTELKVLRERKPTDLWREDLDVFLTKLDQVEEQERKGETKLYKKETKTKGGRKPKVIVDVSPSNIVRRIEPRLSEHIKKVVKAKESKERKLVRKAKEVIMDDKDEFDNLLEGNKKTLKDKIGNSPELVDKKMPKTKKSKKTDGLVQTKLSFKKAQKTSPKKIIISDEEEEEDEEEGDFDENKFGSDNDDFIPPVREKSSRRVATTKKVNYIYDSDDEKLSNDEELFENSMIKEEMKQEKLIISDSDEDIKPVQSEKTSDELFDSLFEGKLNTSTSSDMDTSDIPLGRRIGTEKRRVLSDDEDSEVDTPPKKVKTNRKR